MDALYPGALVLLGAVLAWIGLTFRAHRRALRVFLCGLLGHQWATDSGWGRMESRFCERCGHTPGAAKRHY